MADGGRKTRQGSLLRRAGTLVASVRRMTPMGDAVRAWIAVLASMGVIFFFPLDLESGASWRMFYLAFYDVLCVVWLGLIWLAQNRGGSLRQRVMRTFYGTRGFGGKTGLFTIATVVSIGLFSALTLVPDLGRTATVMSVVGVVPAWGLLHTSFALYYLPLLRR